MIETHAYTAIVSLLALLLYFYMGFRVGQGRGKYNVPAPAVTGNPDFERAYRIQMNTLEWLPTFLVSLWLFSLSWGSDLIAAAIGLVWTPRRPSSAGPASACRRWPRRCCCSAPSAASSSWWRRTSPERQDTDCQHSDEPAAKSLD
jgi:uncharacterized membrane protein YecN with MAPEG domain